MGPGVDYGDLYFQHSRREGWRLEDGIVKDGSHSIEQGVGVRAVSGEKTGFAYSDDIRADALLESAGAARAISRSGASAPGGQRIVVPGRALYAPVDPIDEMATDVKIQSLRDVDQWLRAQDPRVKQVIVSLAGGVDTVLVASSDGKLASDVRPLVRFNVQVIVEQDGRREPGYSGGGGRYGYAELFSGGRPQAVAREALRQALVNLDAVEAPAGTMPVVLGPGWPGVLLHEAVGHGLEGDFNRKGTSVYAGRIGERVAAPGVTIVDDGTLAGRRGSLNIDDEGTPTQCTTLIEDGILRGYMQDTLNARLMGMAPDRQRPPRKLRAPADAAHDQHLHAGRQLRSGRNHRLGEERPVRAQLRRRPGGHHQRQVRVLGHRGLPDRRRQDHPAGEGRHPDRQRPRGDDPREHGRQRPGAG